MKRENLAQNHVCVHTHTHTPLRRWWVATFLIVMMMPMIGKGQEPLSEICDLYLTLWEKSPSQPDYYRLIGDQIHLANHDQTLPTPTVFTMSTCNKASLKLVNGSGVIPYDEIVYQFYNQDGTLFFQYTEPDLGENYEGTTNSFNSGITPDFEMLIPGIYNLRIECYNNGIKTGTYAYYGFQVTPDAVNFTLNAPDTACYGLPVCWSVYPGNYRVLDGNWGTNPYYPGTSLDPFDPCQPANSLGNNLIEVLVTDFCGNTSTISKNIFIIYMTDFTLPTSVCPNQLFNVGEIFYCRYPNNPSSFLWNWGDGTTSNIQYASHSYSTPGTYTIILTVGVYINGQYQTSTISKTITVTQLPSRPLVSGSFTTCKNPGNFIITNALQNTTYTWTSPYSNSINGVDTNKSISWNMNTFPMLPSDGSTNPLPGSFSIISNTNGCIDTTDYKVWKCCTNNNYPVYNDSIVTTSFPSGKVYINGTVIINNNLTQSNTEFCMGPEAKIIVNPPYTFELNNLSTMGQGCRYMWDGIYTESPQSKVKFNSIIVSDAYNAICSKNGGNFEVINTTFSENFIGIKVIDYHPSPFNQINHPGVVYGSNFINPFSLLYPYKGQKAHTGIYTDNVYELTIGNNNQAANTFDNLVCGIQSYNSYITLNKNNFANIKKVGRCAILDPTDFTSLYCETAIHVAKIQRGTLAYTPLVRLTGNETNQNTFTNCDQAYYSYKTWQTISYNTVNSTTTAFFCRDIMNGSIFNNNNINGSKQGIYILNSIPTVKNVTIQSNSISNVTSGGFGMNLLNCQSANTNRVNILNNAINLIPNRACTGIMVAACDSISIKNNNPIGCNAVNSNSYNKTNLGIKISNSPNSIVKGNTLSKLGTSIWAEGLLTGTKFQCNTLTQNYYGFYMPNSGTVATAYSNQGDASMPNDNQWIDHPSPTAGIPTYRITGDATPTIQQKNWYYRAGTNSYYPNVLIGNPAYSFALMSQLPSNAPSPCGSKGGDDDIITNSDSTTTMETIIPDNANLAVQMRYLYMSMLFNSNAEEFATEITQDEQSLYQNIPLIAKINDLSHNDTTIDRAIALNNTLAPVNEMETYRKFVNDIYLSYVTKGVQPTTELIEELYSIADMAPYIGGEAVYIARAILNYEPTKLNKQDVILPLKITTNDNIQFYPNPANDILNISSTESFVLGSKIELFDITGRMIYSSTINSESNNTSISLKGLKQGLYLCIIKNGEEIFSSSKISVVK